MWRLIRLFFYAAVCYVFFRVGFPNSGEATAYHAITIPILMSGATGVFILTKAIELGSEMAGVLIELAFALCVFLYLGFTLPQAKGAAPIQQLLKGEHPTQTIARDGVAKLGLDPNSSAARTLIGLFPKS